MWSKEKTAWCCKHRVQCPTQGAGNASTAKAGSPCKHRSTACPVAQCAALRKGCKYVSGDLIVHVDGSCCPRPCQKVCGDSTPGAAGKNASGSSPGGQNASGSSPGVKKKKKEEDGGKNASGSGSGTGVSTGGVGVNSVDSTYFDAHSGQFETCPDGGLSAHGRCWYLSALGAACVPTCESRGLEFSWYVVPKDKPPMLSQLIDIDLPAAKAPQGLLECFAPGGHQNHSAVESDLKYPGNWSRPECQLACPCKRQSAGSTDEPTETEAPPASSPGTSTNSNLFQLHKGMNCFPGRGATAVPGAKRLEGGDDLLQRCQDACLAESKCEGIVLPNRDTELPLCWMRMHVDPENCAPNAGFDLWLKATTDAANATSQVEAPGRTTTTLTTTDSSEAVGNSFTLLPGLNCVLFHGARPVPQRAAPFEGVGDSLLSGCQEECVANSMCEGVVVGRKSTGDQCWLRMGILPERCLPEPTHDLWIKNESLAKLPNTTTTITTSTTSTATTTTKSKFNCEGEPDAMNWTVAKYEWCCEHEHVGCLEETGIMGRSGSLRHRGRDLAGDFAGRARMCITFAFISLGSVGLASLAVAARRRSQRLARGWTSLPAGQLVLINKEDTLTGCESRSGCE